jgi:GNAT superfamily N-acetyltransferase
MMRSTDGNIQTVDQLTLRDGTRLNVRPLETADKAELKEGVEHLSPESRYRRFFAAKEALTASELAYFTTLDHQRHEALVASEPTTREGVAVARYVIIDDDPPTAEIALTVSDRWQGRGVGTALLRRLADTARTRGIERLSAMILLENTPMLRLMTSLAPTVSRRHEADTVNIVVALTDERTGATDDLIATDGRARSS